MIFEPPTIRAATLSSTLSFVKYRFEEPSPNESVSANTALTLASALALVKYRLPEPSETSSVSKPESETVASMAPSLASSYENEIPVCEPLVAKQHQ